MALIVDVQESDRCDQALRQITRAIRKREADAIGKGGSGTISDARWRIRGSGLFQPDHKGQFLYFGLVRPDEPREPVPRSIYEAYHSMFYAVLVRLPWKYYFTV